MTPEHDEALRLALTEAEALLAEVHVRDCGAHYCRYCSAGSPEWEHGPYCPYVESQEASTRAQHLRARIRALLRAHEARPTCEWWEDGDDCGIWVASCQGPQGELFQFNDGGPVENHFTFCPYCGNAIAHQPAPPAQPEGEGEQHG